MEEGTIVTQIDTNSSNKDNALAPGVAALTGNTAADLAAIAREMGVKLDASGNVAVEQTAQPKAVTPTPVPAPAAPVKTDTVEVPAKFQNQDGTPNVEKIEKSTKSVLEGIEYYKAKEREFNKLQNKVNNPAPQVPPVPTQPTNGIQLTEFERQAAIDILNDARALGIQMSDQQAILQARSDIRMSEAKYAAEQNSMADIRREVGEQRMVAELQGLIDADKDLLTPEVADRVLEIKQSNPNMKSYREAYIQHLGEQEIAKRTGQVKTPNPTGSTVKAPPTPVGPVSRVQSTVNLDKPNSMTTAELEAAVKAAFPRYRGINR